MSRLYVRSAERSMAIHSVHCRRGASTSQPLRVTGELLHLSQLNSLIRRTNISHALNEQVDIFVHRGFFCVERLGAESWGKLFQFRAVDLGIALPSDPTKTAVEIKHISFDEMLHVFGVCSVDVDSRLGGDEDQLIWTYPDHITISPQDLLNLEWKPACNPVGIKSDITILVEARCEWVRE